jgi:hypothetical protein
MRIGWPGRALAVLCGAVVAAGLLVVAPAPAAYAAVTFGGVSSFAMGTNPSSVAVADFNGDGNLDLVTANAGSNNISVRLGNGAGGFGGVTNFAMGTSPQWVAAGRFNADASLDLVTANAGSNNVSVRLGTGTGSFGAAVSFPLAGGTGASSVAVGRFNGDSFTDLAVTNAGSNNVSVLLGAGTGVSAPPPTSPWAPARSPSP